MFPEPRALLDEPWFDSTETKAEFVISRYREANQNLQTTLEKIIARAGLSPWPKLFQNLRAFRATELAEQHPGHVAAAWLGHSEVIANRQHRQVTDQRFARALQQGAQPSVTGGKGVDVTPSNCAPMHSITQDATSELGGTGLEPLAESSGNTPITTRRSANHSALCAQSDAIDPRLAAIVEAWPTLAEGVRDRLARLAAEE